MEDHTPRGMKSVGDLFAKYRARFVAPQASVEKACAEAIQEVAGMTITSDQITYTVATRTISVQAPSIVKSELRFHHQAILNRLEAELGERGAPKAIL